MFSLIQLEHVNIPSIFHFFFFFLTIPCSLEVNGNKVRKKLMAPDISLTLDPSDGSVLSDDLDESGEIDLDGLDTPSENSNEFEWEGKCFIVFI